MKRPRVSIIILNYNGVRFLKKCIPSIKKQSYRNIEIIVADNHSADKSSEYLKSFSDIKVLKFKRNYGYAKANNLAAKKAIGVFLFFLNNDTELFKDTLENLVDSFEGKSILTARQIPSWNKKYYGSSGAGIDLFGYPYVEDQKNPKKTRVFYADGAMIFIKKRDFFSIGMFDEKLFIFQEDIDLSWRAQLYGYKIISCWKARLYHQSGGTVLGGSNNTKKYISSYMRRYLNEKNVIRNLLKNYSSFMCIVFLPILFCLHSIELFILIILGKWKAAKCYLHAYWWNIIHLRDTLKFRNRVQSNRSVSDLVIMKRMYWSYSKFRMFIKLGIPEFQ